MLFDSQTADALVSSEDNLINRLSKLDLTQKFIPKEVSRENLSPQSRDNTSEVSPDGRRDMRKDLEYTTAERSLSAALSHIDTAENVSKLTGASVVSVRRWKQGITDGNTPFAEAPRKTELVNGTRRELNKIRDVAMEKLLKTLNVIGDDDLKQLNAKDASIVAGNLSKVVEKTLPKEDERDNRPTVVMYAPTQMNIENYNVVET